MRNWVRDPRARIVLALVLVLVVGALTGHAVGMADQGMVVGACLAVLAAVGLLATPPLALRTALSAWSGPAPASAAAPTFDHASHPPPRAGTILRS